MIGFNYLGKLGQLGNQMFQYASLRGIAANNNYNFCIPNHQEIFDDGIGNKIRIELFDCFKLRNCSGLNLQMIDENRPLLQEDVFEFKEDLFNNCPDWVSLWGFFQTEKYFKNIESEIREDFEFKDDIVDDSKEIVEQYFDNPIALHIRRGDFIRNSAHHHNLTLDYYEQALNKFDSDRQVVIFTDDPKWALKQELFSDDRFIVSQDTSSYHDLYMMSKCSDFIIANSSFSWWGAWLANTGRVIAPSKWFGPNNAHLDTKDLYPEHWEII